MAALSGPSAEYLSQKIYYAFVYCGSKLLSFSEKSFFHVEVYGEKIDGTVDCHISNTVEGMSGAGAM